VESSDATLGLDLDAVLRLRQRAGQMEAISLTASYDFDVQEFVDAQPSSRPARAVLHETLHAYQTLATSYGNYYLSLRAFQTGRTVALMVLLGQAGRAMKPPLIRQIFSMRTKDRESDQLRHELYLWYLVETVLLYLEGDVDRFAAQVTANPWFRGRSLGSMFSELEGYLVRWWRSRGHDVSAGPALPDDAQETRNFMAFKFVTPGGGSGTGPGSGDTLTVLESGAQIAEYWRTWPATLAEFDDSIATIKYPAYSLWINHARWRDIAPDPRSFALTYSALADLALNAPLLPHHSSFRAYKPGDPQMAQGAPDFLPMTELSPLNRLQSGISATRATRVPPIRDLERDYPRFVQAVCEFNGWPTPAVLAEATLGAQPLDDKDLDWVTLVYGAAQRFRLEIPHAFLDLDVWQNGSPKARFFCKMFIHPIRQFRDKILYHPDNGLVAEFVSNYVMNQYMRQIMIAGNLPVALPFRATQEEIDFYTSVVTETIQRTGLESPDVALVADQGGAHPVAAQ
jgi:hypothetical protein